MRGKNQCSSPMTMNGEARIDITNSEPEQAMGAAERDHRTLPFDKHKTLKDYETRLLTTKRLAILSSAVFSLNWFLGVCALTWASAIILGGLLSDLSGKDFYCVSVLLLLEALRLASANFFGHFFTRKLIYRSTIPSLLKYDDKDRLRLRAYARVLASIVLLIVLAVCIFLPWKRLQSLPQNPEVTHFDSLRHSLRIFYWLVFINAISAVIGLFLFSVVVFAPCFTSTFSLCRYYDHIVWRGLEKGFLSSTDFDHLAFAFKELAHEYRRNLRAAVVYSLYEDLINYLFAHSRGFDAARIAMDSDDLCEQVAAANIVGLWAQLQGAGPSLLLQSRLLTKLADALDHQDTGRAATCSFESLAKFTTESQLLEGQLLEVKNAAGESLVAILCNCISRAVKAKREDKALVFVKVLIQLMQNSSWQPENKRDLMADLQKVFKGDRCLKRTVGVAGKALQLLKAEPSVLGEVKACLRRAPRDGEHILEDEKTYVLELLGVQNLPPEWEMKVECRDTQPRRSGRDANYISGLINLLLFIVTGIAVILCIHFIPF